MDYFSNFIRQPPVTDRNSRNQFSHISDQFTVSKQKGLKGFNDDVSQIQIQSEQINEDSINQIKNQQKLLFSNQQPNKKTFQLHRFQSKDSFFSRSNRIIDSNENQNLIKQKLTSIDKFKDKSLQKVQLESKMMRIQIAAPYQHPKIVQDYRVKEVKSELTNKDNKSKSLQKLKQKSQQRKKQTQKEKQRLHHKKLCSQLLVNLSELKKLKSQIREQFFNQKSNLKKLVQNICQQIQIEINNKISNLLKSTKEKSTQSNEQNELSNKLQKQQKRIQQLQNQLDLITTENQQLQQRLFDMQQKVVGVDLIVAQKFQQKKKELQLKLKQKIKNQSITQSNPNPHLTTSLMERNNFLQEKLKSYQTLLLETDHIRKTKNQVNQLQFTLNEREQQILAKQRETQKMFTDINKKSLDIQQYETLRNRRFDDLMKELAIRQETLQKWQLQLKAKQTKLNEKQAQLENLMFIWKNKDITNIDKNDTRSYNPNDHSQYERFDNDQKERYYTRKSIKTEGVSSFNYDDISLIKNKQKYSPITQRIISFNRSTELTTPTMRAEQGNVGNFIKNKEMKRPVVDFYKPNMAISNHEPQYGVVKPQSPLGSRIKISDHNNNNKAKFYDNQKVRDQSPHNITQRDQSPHMMQHSSISYNSRASQNKSLKYPNQYNRDRNYQFSNDRSTYSKSSIQNSVISGQSHNSTHRMNYNHTYDMRRTKSKYEQQIPKLNNLGNKIQFLREELKSQIKNML